MFWIELPPAHVEVRLLLITLQLPCDQDIKFTKRMKWPCSKIVGIMRGAGPRHGQGLGEVVKYSEPPPMLTNDNIVWNRETTAWHRPTHVSPHPISHLLA